MKSHEMLIEYGYLNTSMRTFGNIEWREEKKKKTEYARTGEKYKFHVQFRVNRTRSSARIQSYIESNIDGVESLLLLLLCERECAMWLVFGVSTTVTLDFDSMVVRRTTQDPASSHTLEPHSHNI